MSAICAVFHRDGSPVSSSDVATLLDAMGEYGAERAVWSPESPDAPVGLGCIPWRVTPEDAMYRPPVRSRDGRVTLVADIRIDNREELAASLGIGRAELRESSDADLLLAAYAAWEAECPARIIGDFAFALWDARRRTLFCARDGMGHRVLAYHESPRALTLATSVRALAALPRIGARLDEQKVADFLVLLQEPDTTFFQGIRRLPGGHTLTADESGVRLARFWSPVPPRRIRFGSDQEYVDGFLEVFGQAVRSRLRSASPVGMMVSGGLDSSSVAVTAAAQLEEAGCSLPTFHAAPREGFTGAVSRGWVADETGDVRAIAAKYPNIELHIRRPDARTPLDDADESFRMTGAPPRNPGNAPWVYGIYRSAAAQGVRAMLVGNKGNATISHTGIQTIRDSLVRGEWRRVWREVHAVARATREGRRSVVRRTIVEPLTPVALAAAARRLKQGRPVPIWEATFSAINPEFARARRVSERAKATRRDYLITRRMGDLEFSTTVLTSGADVNDLYSGYRPWFGVETRDPTADRRVIEYCFGIPRNQYLRNGVTRSLIRRAMEGRLPDEVRNRTTIGAQAPDWIEWLPGMRGEISAELDRLDRSETARRCLDLPRMRALVDRWPSTLTVRHASDYYMLLLRGLMMGRFIRWFEHTYH